ncbi:hypothetical protein [Micromonospora sp. NPDC000442]|uniref:hypothetical protein n=1 Tax=Micromonospora sp. NPDC000442 TaxID=3364217 RepID=UPI00368D0E52
MDVAGLLARAAAMVPADVVNEAGVTVVDVREYLDHDEWEVAFDLLADLGCRVQPMKRRCSAPAGAQGMSSAACTRYAPR